MTINEVDKLEEDEFDSDAEEVIRRKAEGQNPSKAALEKMEDFGTCLPELRCGFTDICPSNSLHYGGSC